MAWEFATACQSDEKLFAACAKVGYSDEDERLFAALARAVECQVNDFSMRNLTKTARVFATAGQSDEKLFVAFARAAERRVGNFDALNLACAAWICGCRQLLLGAVWTSLHPLLRGFESD